MNSKLFILTVLVAIIAIIVFIIVTPSTVFHCERYELPKPPKLEGVLAVNDILTKAEHLLEYKIVGPESIIVEKDTIITGIQNGMIILIQHGIIQKNATFGSINADLCEIANYSMMNGEFDVEVKCGRPLGLRQFDAETVAVIDAHRGIFSVNFKKDDDTVIFTDSSSKWDRRHVMNILLEGIPNGRVLRLKLSTGKVEVIMDKLYFPNGIQLFPDKQSFLVAETGAARIKRHWIAGPRMGKTEIFIDNLPGLPDNIRSGSNGTFWIGVAAIRHRDQFSFLDYFADKPFIRKCILQLVPERTWEWLQPTIATKHGLILQINEKGQVIASAHDPTGQVIREVSQVTETNEHLYLGSYRAPFIARIRKDFIIH